MTTKWARPVVQTSFILLSILWQTGSAWAETACPQERAVYTEKANGYQLSFRTPEPWEASSNTDAILSLQFPDGKTTAWGTTWMPNGTSWNQAHLFNGCELPGKETAGSSGAELDACKVWEGIVYQVVGSDVDYMPFREDPAAKVILLSNFGPTIRYSGMVGSPGEEPHDVFVLSGCSE